MENADQRPRATEPPGDRLSRLSQASLCINESLDVAAAPEGVLEAATDPCPALTAAINETHGEGSVYAHRISRGTRGTPPRVTAWLARRWSPTNRGR